MNDMNEHPDIMYVKTIDMEDIIQDERIEIWKKTGWVPFVGCPVYSRRDAFANGFVYPVQIQVLHVELLSFLSNHEIVFRPFTAIYDYFYFSSEDDVVQFKLML